MSFDSRETTYDLVASLLTSGGLRFPPSNAGMEELVKALDAAYQQGVSAQPTEAKVRDAARFQHLVATVRARQVDSYLWVPPRAPSLRPTFKATDAITSCERRPIYEWRWRARDFHDLRDAVDVGMGVRK